MITFPGGLPLKVDHGAVIGAIGVSGSTVENDRGVAAAGAATLGGPNVDLLSTLPAFFDEKSGGGGALEGVVNTNE